MIKFILIVVLQSAPGVYHESLVNSEDMTRADCIAFGHALSEYNPGIVWECRGKDLK